jgi:molybdopterin-guanine dinucleotide biosynthesis protein A
MTSASADRVTGIVLAGGRSRRFGGDKLMARIGGVTVLELALRALAEVSDELVLVVAASPVPHPLIPAGLPVPVVVVADDEADRGPLYGLITGLRAARHATVIVVGADMPALVPDVLRLLAGRISGHGEPGAILADGERSRPLPMALRRDAGLTLAREILAGNRQSLRTLADSLPAHVIPFREWRDLDPSTITLLDVDSPPDLEAAQARLGAPGR